MRREIARIRRELKATVIYVTHDQVEAMTMGDRIVVMNEGRVEQIGTPLALYNHPETLFVGTFIGSPAMNLLPGRAVFDDTPRFVASGDDSVTLPIRDVDVQRLSGASTLVAGIRPEDLHADASDFGAQFAARVDVAEPLGNEVLLHLRTKAHDLTARVAPRVLPRPGDSLTLRVAPSRVHYFDAETKRALVSAADPAESSLHLGD
jgi:multiple sugar transport system ATP-binding protein